MSTNIVIEKRICLEPELLNKDLKENIFKKMENISINECTKEYGYILNINKLLKIKDSSISSNCEHIFITEFDIKTLKPEIGKEFDGTICMIFVGGIFIIIENKLKVLIPISTIDNFKHDKDQNYFINKKNPKKIIKQGDTLTVKISGIKYSKQNFSCFGNLIEK
jgi:DNA-directed RNA polymerase subunit E'/Rpb7